MKFKAFSDLLGFIYESCIIIIIKKQLKKINIGKENTWPSSFGHVAVWILFAGRIFCSRRERMILFDSRSEDDGRDVNASSSTLFRRKTGPPRRKTQTVPIIFESDPLLLHFLPWI